MSGTKIETGDNKPPDQRDSGDESEDESEVLEESPCGRWQKRREEVRLFQLSVTNHTHFNVFCINFVM